MWDRAGAGSTVGPVGNRAHATSAVGTLQENFRNRGQGVVTENWPTVTEPPSALVA